MTCTDVRDQLLVAEPDELRGAGDSALAAHIRGCSVCAAEARSILEMNMRLDDALQQLTQQGNAKITSHTGAVSLPLQRARRPGRATAYMAAAAVLCLAVAGVMLERQVARSAGESYPLHLPDRTALTAPVVNTTQAGAVAVIRTNNPNITVVWYLQPRRGKL